MAVNTYNEVDFESALQISPITSRVMMPSHLVTRQVNACRSSDCSFGHGADTAQPTGVPADSTVCLSTLAGTQNIQSQVNVYVETCQTLEEIFSAIHVPTGHHHHSTFYHTIFLKSFPVSSYALDSDPANLVAARESNMPANLIAAFPSTLLFKSALHTTTPGPLTQSTRARNVVGATTIRQGLRLYLT
ncbi:hypothetical protein BDV95DRAFT_645738 [Massariosphaeria phaeospora]|uniref:Uncharacterized protein n=1 Tax=Massariosphaeria phaeospora TaxID=100035 RepID=A0A7C8I1E5_9PLEO|nr:hypothetical protein BDV95DRAFT_645738 [Massariosphaeria phaeospora]